MKRSRILPHLFVGLGLLVLGAQAACGENETPPPAHTTYVAAEDRKSVV